MPATQPDRGDILLNQLVERHGRELHNGHAFPQPHDLSSLRPDQLVSIGYSRNKARALIELSQAIIEKRFEPAALEKASDQEALANLQEFRGIERWTAE